MLKPSRDLADLTTRQLALAVPAICYAIIALFGAYCLRQSTGATKSE